MIKRGRSIVIVEMKKADLISLLRVSKETKLEDSLPKRWNKYYLFVLKTIIPIAKKYDLEPNQIIKAILGAWENGKSNCDSLTIHCRARNQDAASFLLTNENEIVSQFPVKIEVLQYTVPQYLWENVKYELDN
jgi:hypothetical protein